MPSHRTAYECAAFYCYPISDHDRNDTIDIGGFVPAHPNGAGVVEYLQDEAYRDERKGTMRTYLVRSRPTDELVGFFSLKAGLVSTKEALSEGHTTFDTIPGVEVAYLGVDRRFCDKYPVAKGCGKVIFNELVLPVIRSAARIVGISRVYIFSIDENRLIKTYRSYGFRSLSEEQERSLHERLKPRGAQGCRFMYMRV